jgi:lysozyme family protein
MTQQFDSRQSVICPTYVAPLQQYKIINSGVVADRIRSIVAWAIFNQSEYEQIQELSGIPWEFIAALHSLECDGDFSKHLANGDSIDFPTVNEPKGIAAGTWEKTALAALHLKGWVNNPELDWDNKLLWLWRAEMWNGWGYRMRDRNHRSPYLWSGTDREMPGKYIADGVWDGNAISKQIGCVAIWDALGVKLIEGKGMNASTGQVIEPIGILTTTRDTWIKEESIDSSKLAENKKMRLPSGIDVKIYGRLADVNHHYQVVVDNGDPTCVRYVYMDHAGIWIDGDDRDSKDSIATHVSDVSNLSVQIKKMAKPIETPIVATTPIDPLNKKAIQREFSRIGLLDGRKGFDDGKWGGLSESAKRAWLRHYGSPNTELDRQSLMALQQCKGYRDLDLRPKDPTKKSHEIATLCLKRMLELNMWLAVSIGSDSPAWNFFYLRGTNTDGTFNKDSIDNMNDLRFLAKINPDGTVEVGYISVATWDAGWKYRKDRMNSNGCFQIDYDKQFWSWRPGMHGVAAPHSALTQQDDGDPLTGTRDDDENGRTATDKHFEDGGAVNHHGTVGRQPQQPIGPYSAGCGVDDDIEAHLNIFMPKIKIDRRSIASGGHLINSCFLDRAKVKGLPLS